MSDLTDWYSELGSKQRDQRVKRFFIDQFSRRYFAWADKDNQRPIGEFVLADNTGRFVTAPWNPPMMYIEWPDRDTLDFRWKFDAMASELAGVTAEWYSLAQQMAQTANLPIPDVGGDVHPTLIGLMGPPLLSPEIPLACEAGEPWLLGQRDAPINLRLQKLVSLGRQITSTYALETIRRRVIAMVEAGETDLSTLDQKAAEAIAAIDPASITYREFLADAITAGQSMAQGAAAWKEHRANLAELQSA